MEKNKVYYKIILKDKTQDETEQARNLLKEMLKTFNLSTTEIIKNEHGKPYFTNDIYFNYSHSKNYIACAISLSEVGIDIDEERVISAEVAKRYLDGKKDIKIWVQKEAYSKLKGIGFAYNFNNINLENIKESHKFIQTNDYICAIYCDSINATFIKLEDSL